MSLKRRQFTGEFKRQVVREIEAGKALAQAAREHQLQPTLITKWRQDHLAYAEQAFAGKGNRYKTDAIRFNRSLWRRPPMGIGASPTSCSDGE